tara:strand:- start:284 stop:418 length:135 start_codon:yes stop_codon:yes gene_type:complete
MNFLFKVNLKILIPQYQFSINKKVLGLGLIRVVFWLNLLTNNFL